MSKSIITSLIWVKKGFARSIPKEYEMEAERLEEDRKFEKKLKK
jgi:hypothetical protein